MIHLLTCVQSGPDEELPKVLKYTVTGRNSGRMDRTIHCCYATDFAARDETGLSTKLSNMGRPRFPIQIRNFFLRTVWLKYVHRIIRTAFPNVETYCKIYCKQWNTSSINSFASGGSEYDSKNGIYKFVLLIDIFRSHDYALRWMPRDLAAD